MKGLYSWNDHDVASKKKENYIPVFSNILGPIPHFKVGLRFVIKKKCFQNSFKVKLWKLNLLDSDNEILNDNRHIYFTWILSLSLLKLKQQLTNHFSSPSFNLTSLVFSTLLSFHYSINEKILQSQKKVVCLYIFLGCNKASARQNVHHRYSAVIDFSVKYQMGFDWVYWAGS